MADNLLSVDEQVGQIFRVTTDNGGTLDTRVVAAGSGGAVDAADVTYEPANPNDWPEPPPANVAEALDIAISEAVNGPQGAVTRVFFVDSQGATGGNDGSLHHPFQTAQAAVDSAIATGYSSVVLMMAPGEYTDPLDILGGILSHVTISGWADVWPNELPTDIPGFTAGANISIAQGVNVAFTRLHLASTSIASRTVGESLFVSFSNCLVHSDLHGADIVASFLQTDMAGDILSTTANCLVQTDGFSWSCMRTNGITIAPNDYARLFYDTGADWNHASIAANGLAIGASVTVPYVYPGARQGEFAMISMMADPVPSDFTATFSHTAADVVYFRLRNDSRVSTNFNEPCRVTVFHSPMAPAPVP